MDTEPLSARLAEVVREVETEVGPKDTLDRVVRLAVDMIPNADDAGVTIVHKSEGPKTVASTSDRGRRNDELQYETGEGPCLSALWDFEVISVPDLEADTRWPDWAKHAIRDADVRSMLCLRLFTTDRHVGALSLYATKPHAFTGDDLEIATLIAAHAAIDIATAQDLLNVTTALETRTTIAQAQGLLMERHGLDSVRAFDVLRRLSSHSNRKLYDIALELMQTRVLPES